MTELHYDLDLQLFADGGDGGASAGGESGGIGAEASNGGEFLPPNAPARAKEIQKKMLAKSVQKVDTATNNKPTDQNTQNTTNTTAEELKTESDTPPAVAKKTYKELIESDDYRADHERYIQKTVGDRMRKHNADIGEANEILSLMGRKYGLDPSSETFRKDLTNALNSDDSVYEKYAEEHDVPIEEAKKMVGLQQQLDRVQKEAEARKAQEERDRVINALRDKGVETKAQYPDFDLDIAMQDPRFMRMVAAMGGDTTMAYEAINHKVLVARAEQRAAAEAQSKVANSVRSNLQRPLDSNISNSSNTTASMPDFRSMNKQQLDEWAASQRRLMRRR
jgi:hypothetical protein